MNRVCHLDADLEVVEEHADRCLIAAGVRDQPPKQQAARPTTSRSLMTPERGPAKVARGGLPKRDPLPLPGREGRQRR